MKDLLKVILWFLIRILSKRKVNNNNNNKEKNWGKFDNLILIFAK